MAIGAVLVTAGAADAAGRIGPHQIRNNAIHTRHIRNGAVTTAKIRVGAVGTHRIRGQAVTSRTIHNGTIRPVDLSPAVRQQLTTTFAGPDWGIVDRHVIGNGDSYLRAGPIASASGHTTRPPRGIGSLGMRVGATSDKASFGNQVSFHGVRISTIHTLSYWIFKGAANAAAPDLQFEINPHLASNPGITFSTLTFENPARPGNVWEKIDATTGPAAWGLTGAAGGVANCSPTPVSARCTWSQIQAAIPDATVSFGVLFNMGTGADASSSAVDALRINNHVYDFEPFGVSRITVH